MYHSYQIPSHHLSTLIRSTDLDQGSNSLGSVRSSRPIRDQATNRSPPPSSNRKRWSTGTPVWVPAVDEWSAVCARPVLGGAVLSPAHFHNGGQWDTIPAITHDSVVSTQHVAASGKRRRRQDTWRCRATWSMLLWSRLTEMVDGWAA